MEASSTIDFGPELSSVRIEPELWRDLPPEFSRISTPEFWRDLPSETSPDRSPELLRDLGPERQRLRAPPKRSAEAALPPDGAQRARRLLDQLGAAEEAGAQHGQHDRALVVREGGLDVALDPDAEPPNCIESSLYILCVMSGILRDARRRELTVVWTEVDDCAVRHLLSQLDLVAQPHQPHRPGLRARAATLARRAILGAGRRAREAPDPCGPRASCRCSFTAPTDSTRAFGLGLCGSPPPHVRGDRGVGTAADSAARVRLSASAAGKPWAAGSVPDRRLERRSLSRLELNLEVRSSVSRGWPSAVVSSCASSSCCV